MSFGSGHGFGPGGGVGNRGGREGGRRCTFYEVTHQHNTLPEQARHESMLLLAPHAQTMLQRTAFDSTDRRHTLASGCKGFAFRESYLLVEIGTLVSSLFFQMQAGALLLLAVSLHSTGKWSKLHETTAVCCVRCCR